MGASHFKSLVHDVIFGTCRNLPKIIEALSADGSCGQHIESSNTDSVSGALFCMLVIFFFVFLPVLILRDLIV